MKLVINVIKGFLVALLASAALINYWQLTEAYGSGPPYYSMTTNMDKWSNPIPFLVIMNIAVLLAVLCFFRWILPRMRQRLNY